MSIEINIPPGGKPPSKNDTPASNSKRPDREKKKPKYKRASFEEDPTEWVSFDIGSPNPIRRQIHKEAIYISCTTFRAAFESEMIEGQTQIYKLLDTDIKAFSLFQQWVYSSRLNLIQTAIEYNESEHLESGEIEEENLALAKLWVFGDRYGIARLQNEALDMMQRAFEANEKVHMRHYGYIYENTTEYSALREYVVYMVVRNAPWTIFDEEGGLGWSKEMFRDLCRVYAYEKFEDGFVSSQRPVRDFYV
ncbi:hypothetical protein DL98DRAFT_656076 [Cadophora sp. DSE1049]|nr:hypothetical protein DL98DRAFT_656076 [Cadophora sp. DSE1049]